MTVKSDGRTVVVGPGDLVKTNPARKHMSKDQALEDDKKSAARKVAIAKAARDFDENADAEGQEIPDAPDVVEESEEPVKPVKKKRAKKSKKVNE